MHTRHGVHRELRLRRRVCHVDNQMLAAAYLPFWIVVQHMYGFWIQSGGAGRQDPGFQSGWCKRWKPSRFHLVVQASRQPNPRFFAAALSSRPSLGLSVKTKVSGRKEGDSNHDITRRYVTTCTGGRSAYVHQGRACLRGRRRSIRQTRL